MGRQNHIPTYTKKDIARRMKTTATVNHTQAAEWIDSVLGAIREIMVSAEPELRIELRDFGVFEVKLTKPKPKARNPRTGEIIFVPQRRKTHFKPGKSLRVFLSGPVAGRGSRGGHTSSHSPQR